MEVLSLSSDRLAKLPRPIATIGTFDGVHLAHRAILEELLSRARSEKGTSLVVTFEPHPQAILNPQTAPSLLTTREEKLAILDRLNLDVVVLVPFTQQLARMKADEFVEGILHRKLGVWEVVIGHDHAFGQKRRGRLETLKQLGARLNFKVDAMQPILHRGKPISSTRIRQKLLRGQVREAAAMLGRPYGLTGHIISGKGRGRTLKYPTANMKVPAQKLIPANGVYAVTCQFLGTVLHGLLNIGFRPTFGAGARTVEIHFFDFQRSLYGKAINIKLIEKIREEQQFEDGAQLSQQIRKDEEMARRLLSSFELQDLHHYGGVKYATGRKRKGEDRHKISTP